MEISKEKKQAYADKYFGGMNCKELREFKSVTPKGHQINGYICNKHNYYLGSLLILKVDGEETEQFIQSFPKIKYYENNRQLDPVKKEHYCFEKLDGSCLIIYPLIVNNTEIEYVPKTRGMAVADKQFLDLFNRLDHSKLDQYYSMYNFDILVFELYGQENQHEIFYKDVDLDLTLIGVYRYVNHILDNTHMDVDEVHETYWLSGEDLRAVSKEYFIENIPLVKIEYNDEYYSLSIVEDSLLDDLNYTNSIFPRENNYSDFMDCIMGLKEAIDTINNNYEQPLLEGVVINSTRSNGLQNYIKVKTSTIEIKHRSENGIPRQDIIKELNKYFDDYQSQIKELYSEDKYCYWPYVREMLLEDYPVEYVDNHKTKNKTERLFLKVWDARMPSPELDTITDELIQDYPNANVVDLIRLFAQKYPQLKKQANTVYSLLEVKLSK
ncbi:hypothetical protein [uncultured Methanobrevibacter sp.]|uniref:hypothetical protein n=1 Tax=uncultured Methanobrevibacter sp. TaxID=253161 RepID=UPI0025EC769C|nr:hypothetical protein [uncultured Methanobrevibacter sp.]